MIASICSKDLRLKKGWSTRRCWPRCRIRKRRTRRRTRLEFTPFSVWRQSRDYNEHWRRGVQIVVRNFPDGPRLRQEADIRIPRCVVSCRTPNHPDLPSAALLAAAANPMTVAEHVEAGTLKVGRRDPNVPAELYGDDRSDLSDWEDY